MELDSKKNIENPELDEHYSESYEWIAEFHPMFVPPCIACIRLFCIGPCPVQQRRRSRAQTQHEGRPRDLYPDHEEGAWARGTL